METITKQLRLSSWFNKADTFADEERDLANNNCGYHYRYLNVQTVFSTGGYGCCHKPGAQFALCNVHFEERACGGAEGPTLSRYGQMVVVTNEDWDDDYVVIVNTVDENPWVHVMHTGEVEETFSMERLVVAHMAAREARYVARRDMEAAA